MNCDDDKELWDLLGQRQPQTLSPFFARNVVRVVRETPPSGINLRRWFSLRSLIPAAAVAILIAGGGMYTISHNRSSESVIVSADDVPDVVAQLDAADYEIVADLDDLIASQEDDSWDDTPTL